MFHGIVTNCHLRVGQKQHLGCLKQDPSMLIILIYFLTYVSCLCLVLLFGIHLLESYALICEVYVQAI